MVTTKMVSLAEAIEIERKREIMANNKGIICSMRDNHESFKDLILCHNNSSYHQYCLVGNGWGDDWQGLGELGGCIGRNTHLTHLKLYIDLNLDDDDDYDEYAEAEPQALPENEPRMKQTILFCKGLATNTYTTPICARILQHI